jgi:transcriptional regulator with XRE-family HTH domain
MQLSRIERLKSSPTEEKIRALSQAFDVPISVLFDDNLLERALSGVMTSLLSVESRLVDSRIRVRALQTMGRYGLKDAFETAQRGGRIRSTRAEQDSLRFELTKPDDV